MIGGAMHILLRYLSRCPGCGAAARAYCPRCWYEINRLEPTGSSLHLVTNFPFTMRAAWIWKDESQAASGWISRSEIIRQSVLMSKGSPRSDVISAWSGDLYQRASIGGYLSNKCNWLLLVPPSERFKPNGHSLMLARELSKLAGLIFPDFPVFERNVPFWRRGSSQKSKSRAERLETEMSLSRHLGPEKWSLLRSADGYIFMDDVIATGSTAIAAWKALGKPLHFEAWAMVWRAQNSGE